LREGVNSKQLTANRQRQKQIPFGNDKKKGKNNKSKSVALLRVYFPLMTMELS